MRRTRRLTSNERWELGLFLAMLIVGCLCFTAILNIQGLPRLFAFAFQRDNSDSGSAPAVTDLQDAAPALSMVPVQEQPRPALVPVSPTITVPPPPAVAPVPQMKLVPPPAVQEPVAPRVVHRKPAPEVKWYHGAKYRFVKTLRLRVTAYAPDKRCCWPYPGTTTASGLSVKTNHGRLVAADTRLIPMHALVAVPGYSGGTAVPVLDRGGAIKGHRLDVLMPTFADAKQWGSRILSVKIYMPVDD